MEKKIEAKVIKLQKKKKDFFLFILGLIQGIAFSSTT